MFLQGHGSTDPNSDDADSKGAIVPVTDEDGELTPVPSAKRPRGRPPGSKNKPKPPPATAIDELSAEAAMQAFVLEIAAGEDIIACLSAFSRRRNLTLSVMAGAGAVSDVALRGPGGLAFPGAFEILSISATFFPQPIAGDARTLTSTLPVSGGTAVTLAGPRGQIFGGVVLGPLRAATAVTIIAAAFASPSYHHLPAEDDVSASSPPLTKFNSQLSSDIGWS